ncbi:Ubiquitin-conjugating_enzyme E2 [Hexamita inflata]|uniref:Ubiquitin-conjugating enzyme E2 n=1 Tax=Hexamita inflata TaxID=28002 RepID=A0AA86RC17_9EUKA|nr:Ubiquitin-conjugating enzyme E2 [Hexamita inflata]
MNKRLQAEYKQLLKQQEELSVQGISFTPSTDLSQWTLFLLFNELDSLYYGKKYQIQIRVPSDYPFKPPKCRFTTSIFHPNIKTDTGEICLNIINDEENEWTPANTLQQVAFGLQSLINGPNCDSPLNLDAGSIFRRGDLRCYRSLINYFGK